jgi:phosphoribosylformimino-5-aminoimidazole carboxamide ribonucleotide (ProFAR) isomerase
MILFPAIDLKGGQCVRLIKGDMDQATTYNTDPAAIRRPVLRRWASAICTSLTSMEPSPGKAGTPML